MEMWMYLCNAFMSSRSGLYLTFQVHKPFTNMLLTGMSITHLFKKKYIDSNYFQNYKECWCGDDPYQYGPDDVGDEYIMDYDCNFPCNSDFEQICGGAWRLLVYATGNQTDLMIFMA